MSSRLPPPALTHILLIHQRCCKTDKKKNCARPGMVFIPNATVKSTRRGISASDVPKNGASFTPICQEINVFVFTLRFLCPSGCNLFILVEPPSISMEYDCELPKEWIVDGGLRVNGTGCRFASDKKSAHTRHE